MRITSAVLLSAAAAVACAMQEPEPESQHGQLYARNRFAKRALPHILGDLLPGGHKSAASEVQDTSTSPYVKRDEFDLFDGIPVLGDIFKRSLLEKLLGGADSSDTASEVQDASTSPYVEQDDQGGLKRP
ncbi:hypothetical protein BGZ83_011813 [Gryganskiella cystojenkinii]|nr:hypothetical protein BGZ83_011813 [Gryganskiella cystojenkinii]